MKRSETDRQTDIQTELVFNAINHDGYIRSKRDKQTETVRLRTNIRQRKTTQIKRKEEKKKKKKKEKKKEGRGGGGGGGRGMMIKRLRWVTRLKYPLLRFGVATHRFGGSITAVYIATIHVSISTPAQQRTGRECQDTKRR